MSSVITPLQHQIHSTLHSFYQLHSPTPIGDPDSPDERLRLETQRGLHHGPSSNWRNLHSTRRLYLACQTDDDQAAADAIAAGAAVNAVGTADGLSPLHVAAEHNSVEVCRLLLDNGATSDPLDLNGHTPLLRALQFESEKAGITSSNCKWRIKDYFFFGNRQLDQLFFWGS